MLSFFPRDVFSEIFYLIETVSEGFPSYSYLLQLMIVLQSTAPRQYTYIDDFNDDLKQWKGRLMTFKLIIFRVIIYAQKEIPETNGSENAIKIAPYLAHVIVFTMTDFTETPRLFLFLL